MNNPMLWVVLLLVPELVAALCPVRCTCDDHVLEASCVDAALEVVPFQLNPELKKINLRNNKIINILYTLGFYTNLRDFDVSQNKITSLGTRNFELQEKLINLNVSDNLIRNLNKDTFNGLKNLRVLDLSNNQLGSLEGGAFLNLPNLVKMFVANNKIETIENNVFEKLKSLSVLKLDENVLLDMPTQCFRHLFNLKHLGLSGNLIENIKEDATYHLKNLETLTLNGNLVSRIDLAGFDGLPSLESLDLSDNNLTTIPTESLSKLNNLTELDLSGNEFQMLKPVAFQSLFELRRVKLSRLEKLRRIDVRAFVDNIKLEYIEMDDNQLLVILPWRLFHGNPMLVQVSVRNNGLNSLDASHFPLDQLTSLSMGGNPLQCNCSLLWLWLLSHKQMQNSAPNSTGVEVLPVLDIGNIRCAAPVELRGISVGEIPEAAVRCDNTWIAILLALLAVLLLVVLSCVLLVLRCRNRRAQRTENLDPPHHLHQNGAMLMLLGQQDSLDNFGMRTNKEVVNSLNSEGLYPHRLATWEAATRDLSRQDSDIDHHYQGQYTLEGTTKKPKHIVFV